MLNIKNLLIKVLNLTVYISPADQFLAKFRKKHPDLSTSQRQEQQKFAHLNKLRDQVSTADKPASKLWDQF